jgi:hypothetical protein
MYTGFVWRSKKGSLVKTSEYVETISLIGKRGGVLSSQEDAQMARFRYCLPKKWPDLV